MNDAKEIDTYLFEILVIFIIVFCFLFYVTERIIKFLERRRYIKMEIGRSEGSELRYWQYRLRRHWLTNIPIFGFLFRHKRR